MAARVPPQCNRLIGCLPRPVRERLMARCAPAELESGAVLCEPDRPHVDVLFPISGSISLVASVHGHPPLEVALIGNEGMLGATVALGIASAPLRAVVRGPGSAWRMSSAQFQRELRESPPLARTLNRYLYVMLAQLTQAATCLRFHEIEARLARWLLMSHDRAESNRFHGTHQALADMLGVQRSAITIAAGALQRKNLIRYARGAIRIVSRTGLEAASCECYDAAIDDYTQRFARR